MTEQHKNFMNRWYEQVWNKGNESAIDEMFHPEGLAYGLGEEPVAGPEGFKLFYKAFRSNLKDININITQTWFDGDYIISLCVVKAMYLPTGKPVNFSGISVALVKDGLLMSGQNFFDFITYNLQIGKITAEQLE